MTVVLSTSRDAVLTGNMSWAATGTGGATLDPKRYRPGVAAALERAFEHIVDEWIELARALAAEPNGHLSHAAACATNVSDFGESLAWSHLVGIWAKESARMLVICDDPWLFRHLAGLEGVSAGRPPPLKVAAAKARLRGMVARAAAAVRFALAALRLRRQAAVVPEGRPAILVYGHPASDPDGRDAYFGSLMTEEPAVIRILHVDCLTRRARELASGARTFSLHGFGSPWTALELATVHWHLRRRDSYGNKGWLVARAAAREASGAQSVALAWQIHCQERWLAKVRPSVVLWPWEGHAWERSFIRACRVASCVTVGYQHSVVGRQMLNYRSGPDASGAVVLPDHILTSGPVWRRRLAKMGIPLGSMRVGGAWRMTSDTSGLRFDPKAVVFVALPFDHVVAKEMLAACETIAAKGHLKFIVKDHPMAAFSFVETPSIRRTTQRLDSIGSCRAVVYAATTVGVEAALAGIPTIRFVCTRRLAMDITPEDVAFAASDADGLEHALTDMAAPPVLDRSDIFAPVDRPLWQHLLERRALAA